MYAYFRRRVGEKHGSPLPEGLNGEDYGHLVNYLRFCGWDAGLAQKGIEALVLDWNIVKDRYPLAKSKLAPSLYLLDTLKQEVTTAAATGEGFAGSGKNRESAFAVSQGQHFKAEDWCKE